LERTKLMSTTNKTLSFLVLIVLCTLGTAYAGQDSPADVVKLFSSYYGGAQMDKTANFTTEHFRDDMPKSVWVVDTWKALRQIDYKRVYDSIADTKVKSSRAVVILNTKIETLAGETTQKEIYYLIKEGKQWLIDELRVTEEDVEVTAEEIRL